MRELFRPPSLLTWPLTRLDLSVYSVSSRVYTVDVVRFMPSYKSFSCLPHVYNFQAPIPMQSYVRQVTPKHFLPFLQCAQQPSLRSGSFKSSFRHRQHGGCHCRSEKGVRWRSNTMDNREFCKDASFPRFRNVRSIDYKRVRENALILYSAAKPLRCSLISINPQVLYSSHSPRKLMHNALYAS